MDDEAERAGVTTIQGIAELAGGSVPLLRRAWFRYRFPDVRGVRFYLPPRIAFEPRGSADAYAKLGADETQRACRAAWGRGQPAIVSTHRLNYAHLDAAWSEAGRAALRDLLQRLVGDGAMFVTDAELRAMIERGWSVRPVGSRGALLRYYGLPREPVRFPAPPGIAGVSLGDGPGADRAKIAFDGGTITAVVHPGEYLLEWRLKA
jgi:hypothetical protein